MDPRRILCCAFNPGGLLRASGLLPDPWQETFLLSPARFSLLNCSRQVGKSTVVAALALHTALFRPGAVVLLLSPSARQSGEIFRKTLALFRPLRNSLAPKRENERMLELANGSRVLSLPGKEQYLRSFGGVGLLVLDEAARVPDDLYRAVRPMLAVSGGRLVALSTPCGKKGWFHDAWHSPEEWLRLEIPWRMCPRILPSFIESERRALGDGWVEQEYECRFTARQGLVYPEFLSCVEEFAPVAGQRLGGIDFGWRNPFAAVWGALDSRQILWIEGERHGVETPLQDHMKRLPAGVRWWADPSGAAEMAALRAAGFSVRAGKNAIAPGIAAVTARIRQGLLKVSPRCAHLIREAGLYRYPDRPGEKPLDEENHALAALRYLVASLPPSPSTHASFPLPKVSPADLWRRFL
ncbi:MAG: hypothetical protein EXR99_08620 [Gemmataceae bacterium]|nr:hypothetical protein [Gemmataceae bacterium]